MTEFTNSIPFTGIMVKPRQMPNLNYPRFTKWYNTIVPISSNTAHYEGHEVKAGRNFNSVAWARRQWHVSTPPSRTSSIFDASTSAVDITTPFYMLAGTTGNTASTEDTIVGPDYCNLPIQMHHDIKTMDTQSSTVEVNSRALFMRVLAINHKFTFQNWSRFPLEVYYTVLPIGFKFPILQSIFDPHPDMSKLSFKKIVVPAVRDVGDRSKKTTIDLSMNLQKLWPEAYLLPPGTQMTGTTAASSANSNSPWITLIPGNTSVCEMANIPPGQIADDSFGTPDLTANRPVAGLRLQWWAKLQNPRDLGSTTETNDASGGDYTGTNYDVHWSASWLTDIIRTTNDEQPHTGEKAYPNTVA